MRWIEARASLRDLRELPPDPGPARIAEACVAWLGRAEDAAGSGGVPRSHSLRRGWAAPYPETTGYIVPTMLAYSKWRGDTEPRRRALRMLDWLASIQLECGAFQGGTVADRPRVPVAFNTGQVLLGLVAGVRELGVHRGAMVRAADWLVSALDPDGAFRRFPSPFLAAAHPAPSPHAWDAHVAWALFEAARLEPGRGYAEAARRSIAFTRSLQRENGFLERCCLDDPARPLTHTLGYALRGLVEAHRFDGARADLDAACLTADALLGALDPRDGFLPGRIDEGLRGAAPWCCLTGSAQLAIAWLLLHEATGRSSYREAGRVALSFVRRTVALRGPPELRGGVQGSFPITGRYGRFQRLSWAAKFLIDGCLLELGAR